MPSDLVRRVEAGVAIKTPESYRDKAA